MMRTLGLLAALALCFPAPSQGAAHGGMYKGEGLAVMYGTVVIFLNAYSPQGGFLLMYDAAMINIKAHFCL